MKKITIYSLSTLAACYLVLAIWMNTVAFVNPSCGSVVFSLTWPMFALDKYTGIGKVGPYYWVEYHTAGFCLDHFGGHGWQSD